jgi:hypothetical protein
MDAHHVLGQALEMIGTVEKAGMQWSGDGACSLSGACL